jgi:acyl carrier protein
MSVAELAPVSEWWDILWRSAGMNGSVTVAAVGTSLLALCLMVLMKRRHQPPVHPTGMRCSEAAGRWAEKRFPHGQEALAAHVATLLCENFAIRLSELEAETDCMKFLGRDGMEAVEYLLALEESLGVELPEDVPERLLTVKGAVEILQPLLEVDAAARAEPARSAASGSV